LHIDLLADGKHLGGGQHCTSSVFTRQISGDTEFFEDFARLDTGFGQMTG